MFKRRRTADESDRTEEALAAVDGDLEDALDPVADELDADDDADEFHDEREAEDDDAAAKRPAGRTDGPFDESDIEDDDVRIDLGSLRIPPVDQVEVRLEIDEESGTVQAVTLVAGESAMQVGVFAAPRTEGIWQEVRTEIASQITSSGGTVDHREGPFGPELRANVQGTDDKGRPVSQPLRFVGVDGPRWFLRGLLSGPGVANEDAAAPLLDTFSAIVVVRGTDPRAPHEPLPITLPTEVVDENPEAAGHDLNPFRRGPEITEIR